MSFVTFWCVSRKLKAIISTYLSACKLCTQLQLNFSVKYQLGLCDNENFLILASITIITIMAYIHDVRQNIIVIVENSSI